MKIVSMFLFWFFFLQISFVDCIVEIEWTSRLKNGNTSEMSEMNQMKKFESTKWVFPILEIKTDVLEMNLTGLKNIQNQKKKRVEYSKSKSRKKYGIFLCLTDYNNINAFVDVFSVYGLWVAYCKWRRSYHLIWLM